jgi:hypothetical protein
VKPSFSFASSTHSDPDSLHEESKVLKNFLVYLQQQQQQQVNAEPSTHSVCTSSVADSDTIVVDNIHWRSKCSSVECSDCNIDINNSSESTMLDDDDEVFAYF